MTKLDRADIIGGIVCLVTIVLTVGAFVLIFKNTP